MIDTSSTDDSEAETPANQLTYPQTYLPTNKTASKSEAETSEKNTENSAMMEKMYELLRQAVNGNKADINSNASINKSKGDYEVRKRESQTLFNNLSSVLR